MVVTTGAGQVVVFHRLPAFGPEAAQASTGTFVVMIGPGQVIVSQLLPALPVCGVQTWTGVDRMAVTLQDVVTQPLPAVGPEATHVPEGMLLDLGVQIVV